MYTRHGYNAQQAPKILFSWTRYSPSICEITEATKPIPLEGISAIYLQTDRSYLTGRIRPAPHPATLPEATGTLLVTARLTRGDRVRLSNFSLNHSVSISHSGEVTARVRPKFPDDDGLLRHPSSWVAPTTFRSNLQSYSFFGAFTPARRFLAPLCTGSERIHPSDAATS